MHLWLRREENIGARNWTYMMECVRMLENLDVVWDQQTMALVDTRRSGVSETDASQCVNKARTQSTGMIPRPKNGEARKDAEKVPCVRALRLFSQLVNRKV